MASKKQIFIPIVICAVGAGLLVALSAMKEPPKEKPEVKTTPFVAVQSVVEQPLSLDVESYGVVQPKYETKLIAQVSGQIVSLSDDFVRGGFIKKGQLLATIDPSDYEAALIEAEANLATAMASLEQEKAQGKVAAREWQRIVDTSPTELSLRKPQLAQEMAKVKAARAAVKRASRNLERTKIISPYDAMIENRSVGLGSFVSMGSDIGMLLNVAVAKVRLPVADNQLRYLQASGVNAQVTFTTKTSGINQQWHAKIARSEGVIDSSTRMNYLVAEIIDPYGLTTEHPPLRYGTYVNAKISGISVDSAVTVSRHLINHDQIAVLDEDNKLEFRDVDILRMQGKDVVISSGLATGDKVITSALDYPVSGMQLAILGEEDDFDDEQPAPTGDEQTAIAFKEQ